MSQVHRDGLMFKFMTKEHHIVFGFKRAKTGKCSVCGARIPEGNTICDSCFKKEKSISKK